MADDQCAVGHENPQPGKDELCKAGADAVLH